MEPYNVLETDVMKKDMDEWYEAPETGSRTGAIQLAESQPVENQCAENQPERMLPGEEIDEMKSCWDKLQIRFVDDPRLSADQAYFLISTLLQRLAEVHYDRVVELKDRTVNDGSSTEDLRVALQRYRSVFEHLIEV
jgi:hypothetical protein